MSGTDEDKNSFQAAAESGRRSLIREFWDFLATNKKWWLFPVLVAVLMLGALVALGGVGGIAPFIYTLF